MKFTTYLFLLLISSCSIIDKDSSWCSWIDDDSFVEEEPPVELVNWIKSGVKDERKRSIEFEKYRFWKSNDTGDFLGCIPSKGFGAPSCGATYDYFSKIDGQWLLNPNEEMIVMCHAR